MSAPDTRAITLVDIPLLRRLTGSSVILDSETGLTRDARGPASALLSGIVFPRGLYTLVSRSETQQVIGQFRYRPEDVNAHMVYLAPGLADEGDDSVWLHILDAMAREAGRHGAHALVAEVEPDTRLFEIMRQARFATYARQTIWRHEPLTLDAASLPLPLRPETSNDQIGIMSLICSTIPAMLQQVAAPQGDMQGFVYRKGGQVEAYIAISEGDQGVYLLPFIHPDVLPEAAEIVAAAIARCEHNPRVPIYACIRSYQPWLETAMQRLGFAPWIDQAIMVRHITAGVRGRAYQPLKATGTLERVKNAMPQAWSAIILPEEERELT
jgi:hypothetical protein